MCESAILNYYFHILYYYIKCTVNPGLRACCTKCGLMNVEGILICLLFLFLAWKIPSKHSVYCNSNLLPLAYSKNQIHKIFKALLARICLSKLTNVLCSGKIGGFLSNR